ncbi:hypothetical protein PWR05_35850 [Paraburkholderia sp. A2RI-6]|uniref:hypothetical protein n=1 Tax=Paraburkholderia sp. A2RI-6 TaxID=3028371 RepID=UPI003B7DC71F
MYLVKEGRKHYLDFLRNITPQALLVLIGAVYMHGGLQGQPTAEKITVGIVLWGMAAFAAWCSVSLFFSPSRKATSNPKRSRLAPLTPL